MAARDDYEDDNSVDALHRFISDQTALKTVMNLAHVFQTALHDDDSTVDDVEFPELSRNDRLILMKSIFDLLSELMSNAEEDDTEDAEDEYASVNIGGIGVEIAKDKRMSAYYKAFMGTMRNLVNPWHSDKNKWLALWVKMGMDLYNKSPADSPDQELTVVIKNAEDASEEESVESNEEEAAVMDSTASLPTKVMRELTNAGFIAMTEAEDGDSAWIKTGANDGFPDRQVILVRRKDESYMVIYSLNSKTEAYGRVQKRRTLDESASAELILQVLAYMYDAMTES